MPRGSSGGATGVSSPPHTSSLAVNSWTSPFSNDGGVAQTDVALSLVGKEALCSQDANCDRLQSQFRGFSKKTSRYSSYCIINRFVQKHDLFELIYNIEALMFVNFLFILVILY